METANTITKRIWLIGSAKVEDQFSMLPFKQAFEMLAKSHAQVRHTQIFESDGAMQEDGSIVYKIPVLAAKTNG